MWNSLAYVGLTVLCCIVLSWGLSKKWKNRPSEPVLRLPPGDSGFPVVGDTLNYILAFYNNRLQSFYEKRKAEYGPIFKASIMGQPTVFLDCPDGNKLMFTQDHLVTLYWPTTIRKLFGRRGLVSKSGEQHRVLRGFLANHILGPNVVHRYIGEMEAFAKDHIQKFWLAGKDGTVVKAYHLNSDYFFAVVAKQFWSLTDEQDVKDFRQLYKTFAAGLIALPVNLPGFSFYRSLQARARMVEKLNEVLLRRKDELKQGIASPDQDMLCMMLTQTDEQGRYLENDEIISTSIELLFTGHGANASVVTTVIQDLAKHPEVYNALLREHAEILSNKADGEPLTKEDIRSMKRTWQAVQESLRRMPPLPVIFREAKTTFVYKGFTIPKGWKLVAGEARVANPQLIEHPDEYNPSRWDLNNGGGPPYSVNLFGGGERRCPGEIYGRVDILVFLHHFLKNVKWELVETDEKVVWAISPHYPKGMPVKSYRKAGILD